MNGLLCALMVGTRCMMWHPKGSELPYPYSSYGEIEIEMNGSNQWGPSCIFSDIAEKIAIKKPGVVVYFSCTESEKVEWSNKWHCANESAIQRINDRTCK